MFPSINKMLLLCEGVVVVCGAINNQPTLNTNMFWKFL